MTAGQPQLLGSERQRAQRREAFGAEPQELGAEPIDAPVAVALRATLTIERRERDAVLLLEDQPHARNPVVYLAPDQVLEHLPRIPGARSVGRLQQGGRQ